MQPGVLRALEFDRIVAAVRTRAVTPMGDERLARMVPSTDPQKVAQQLGATTEAVRYLVRYGSFPLIAPAELGKILDALAVANRWLEPAALLALAAFVESV
jgi:dsDNA-specific endonuclease/ATPase MutS2